MTVGELMDRLKEYPKKAEVYCDNGTYFICGVDTIELAKDNDDVFVLLK